MAAAPHRISDRFLLAIGKGEFAQAIPHRDTRRKFIASVASGTDLRGMQLRRWLRRVACMHNVSNTQ